MNGLHVRDLTLRHAGAPRPALDRVHLHAPPRAMTAVLGPSGSGKTSLLRAIAGQETPQAGQMAFDGRDLRGAGAPRIGIVPQAGGLFPHLTVLENARFALDAAGVRHSEAQARALEALRSVGLARHAAARSGALSGGEQQRVALARVLVQQPELLLLDEPLSSVERALRRTLKEEIRGLQRELGLAVLYVTHDHQEALSMADHLVLLDQGRVVQAGSPRELYEQPATAFAAAFMGDATVLRGVRDAQGRVQVGGQHLEPRFPGPAGAVRVAVRPEAWRIRPCTVPGMAGTVTCRRFLGRLHEYTIATHLGPVLVHVPTGGVALETGAPVSLLLSGRAAAVLAD